MSSTPVLIRALCAQDISYCVALTISTTTRSEQELYAQFSQELGRVDRELFLAEEAGLPLGYARISYHAQPDQYGNPAGYYLGGLVIDPTQRRRGLGHKLTVLRMQHIFEHAEQVWYFANARNHASIALHERLGFISQGPRSCIHNVEFDGGIGLLFCCSRKQFAAQLSL